MVVRLRVGVSARRKGVDAGGFVPFFHGRSVRRAGVVEEVAALERHLVALAPRVRIVDADGVDRRHAALRPHHILAYAAAASAARIARHAQNVFEREVLLVDVVEKADHRNAAAAVENIDVAARQILQLVFGLGIRIVAQPGVEFSELALAHVRVGDDVDGLVALAVVHARKFGRIAQFVVHLDAVDGLCRQRLDGRGDIFAEELLAVDENLLHLLALRLDRTVVHRDAGHLLQQPFHIGIGNHLERAGVVAHRVAFLRRAQGLGFLDHGFDAHARLEPDFAQALPGGLHPEGRFVGVIAEKRHRQAVFAVGQRRNRNTAFVGRREVLFLVRRSDGSHRQHGAGHRFSGLVVENRCRDRASLLSGRRQGNEHKQGCK